MNSVFIPHKFPSLNEYISAMNRNRFVGNKMKQEFTQISEMYCMRLTAQEHPVQIHFSWYEDNAKRDPDNIVFSKKFVLDGLVKAGVIPNDTQKWVRSFTDEVIVLKGGTPGVRITIERGGI